MTKSVCIYCAASSELSELYYSATRAVAEELVRGDIKIVFGGGAVGLMGELADTCLKLGGEIKGVIPQFMRAIEYDHPGVKEMIVTESMHERKAELLSGVNAVVVLPGGCGTFEELFEVLTLKKHGRLDIPVVLLNINQYFEPLIALFQHCASEKFMQDEDLDNYTVIDEPSELLKALDF